MSLYASVAGADLYLGDALSSLPLADASVQCCVTSPPYWGLRDYGEPGQIGLEATPEEYVARLVEVFREVRRVLREDGVLWLNLGDSYASGGRGCIGQKSQLQGSRRNMDASRAAVEHMGRSIPAGYKSKDLIGVPWMVAFALRADGWYLRSDVVWHKPNPMPESVTDRPTKAHEYVFLLTKSERYFYDADAVREPLATDPRENYPARARITGRGEQGGAEARGNDRDKSGGFPLRERPQRIRARELAREAGLTDEHISAISAAGITDTGKSQVTQSGSGKNTPEVLRLAAEAKRALGGYYREFLSDVDGRNRRSVWTIATRPYAGAHFATMPRELAEVCVKAGSRPGNVVLDPFNGAATTGVAALGNGRRYVGRDLNAAYLDLSVERLRECVGPLFAAAGGAA